MAVYPDFEDLLRCLNTVEARYLVVGAHAVSFYTEPRYTKDLDLWIDPQPENAKKVYGALHKFGAPLKGLELADLVNPKMVFQIGVAPIRIDIIMGLGGLEFAGAWANKKTTKFGKEKAYVMGIKELIKAKKISSRLQDKLDLKKLSKVLPRAKKR